MNANDKQIGGTHYKLGGEEHWDRVHRLDLNYHQACATKYIERAYRKGQLLEDLKKAQHFIEKLIELEEGGINEGVQMAMNLGGNFDHGPTVAEAIRQHENMVAAAHIKPTAYVSFVFEGGNAHEDLFTCRQCNEHFYVHVGTDPNAKHVCEGLKRMRRFLE